MSQLFFPYSSPRPGQIELANKIIETFKKKGKVAIEAPNGFGKTSSALSAAFFITSEYGAGVVYAVRTKREEERVLQEAKLFKNRYSIKLASTLSMSDGCLLRKAEPVEVQDELLPMYCLTRTNSRMCHYYERLSMPAAATWKGFNSLSDLLVYCSTNGFCPYMYSRKLAGESQIIITTYNHILDNDRLESFRSSRENWREWVLICDEAHNIQELSYLVNSRVISLRDIQTAYDYFYSRRDPLMTYVASILINVIMRYRAVEAEQSIVIMKEIGEPSFKERLRSLGSLYLPPPFEQIEVRRQLSCIRFIEFCRFLAASIDRPDCRVFMQKNEEIYLKVCNLLPDNSKLNNSFTSIIFISATSNIVPEDFERFIAIKDFSWNARCLTIIDRAITSAYTQRSDEMFKKISLSISNIRELVRGPMAAFFTSYSMLKETIKFLPQISDMKYFIEKPSMDVTEQEKLIDSFLESEDGLLLAVAGGKFAEGEDYKGGDLRCAILVGLPLPPPSIELSERLKFLAHIKGRKLAYETLVLRPAVNRVVQSAGRVVRNTSRKGIVILMDRRFSYKNVQNLFPSWLKNDLVYSECSSHESIKKILEQHFVE